MFEPFIHGNDPRVGTFLDLVLFKLENIQTFAQKANLFRNSEHFQIKCLQEVGISHLYTILKVRTRTFETFSRYLKVKLILLNITN